MTRDSDLRDGKLDGTRGEFRALVEQMLPMQNRLEQGHYRKRYQTVAHIAHGWLKRCVRTAGALVVLQDAGYEGEAPPLARSMLEHLIGLRWLLAEGDGISAPLRTTHARETTKLRDALRSSAIKADEESFAEVLASTEHDDHGRDHFHAFAHRAKHYAVPEDVTLYQVLVMESHATYQSGVLYWDPETGANLDTSRTVFNSMEFAACYLYRALVSYGAIFVAPPWRVELEGIRARLMELDPDLRSGSLD